MAMSPIWKVYDRAGKYEASAHHPETAAAIVSFLGDGATVRYGHNWTVWTEGSEDIPASESYDIAADTMCERVESRRKSR